MKMRSCLAVSMACSLVLFSFSVQAYINPKFTPLVLANDSQRIALVSIKKTDKDGVCEMNIMEVIKGDKTDRKPMVLDFNKSLNGDTRTFLLNHLLSPGNSMAIFFVGKYKEKGEDAAELVETKAFIHAGAKWIELISGSDPGRWETQSQSSHMEGTWAGGSDMLLRAVRYALSDGSARFPVMADARWDDPVKIGRIDGVIRARPVDLDGDGRLSVFVTSLKGDHLFSFNKESGAFRDITEGKKLTSKSRVAGWGDINGDGRLDLASSDGKALTVFLGQPDGTFKAQPLALPGDVPGRCMALAVVDAGLKDKVGLLISGPPVPLIIRDPLCANPRAEALAEGGAGDGALGMGGESLIADFDGDSIADVMSLFEKGSILFKGKGAGVFMPGVNCDVALGTGANPPCIADFDADGRFDVLTAGMEGEGIWQNEGNGKFVNYANTSGELAYISKQNGVDSFLCDVNNDGRQDIMITYSSEPGLHVFFNRGFRSFGHAHDLDIQEKNLLESAATGAITGCIADFNGDGAQDMLAVDANGEVWLLPGGMEDGRGSALSVVATLPLSSSYKGAVKVVGWGGEHNDRCLGAWNVMPGVSDAFFGTRDAGIIRLKWQLPGGSEQSADVRVESKQKRFALK